MRDDSGRLLHIELDLERSLVAHFPPVFFEQTSGVLRHTESVQDDKVQKQDWKQSLEKKVQRTARLPTQLKPQAQTARTQRSTAQ